MLGHSQSMQMKPILKKGGLLHFNCVFLRMVTKAEKFTFSCLSMQKRRKWHRDNLHILWRALYEYESTVCIHRGGGRFERIFYPPHSYFLFLLTTWAFNNKKLVLLLNSNIQRIDNSRQKWWQENPSVVRSSDTKKNECVTDTQNFPECYHVVDMFHTAEV